MKCAAGIARHPGCDAAGIREIIVGAHNSPREPIAAVSLAFVREKSLATTIDRDQMDTSNATALPA